MQPFTSLLPTNPWQVALGRFSSHPDACFNSPYRDEKLSERSQCFREGSPSFLSKSALNKFAQERFTYGATLVTVLKLLLSLLCHLYVHAQNKEINDRPVLRAVRAVSHVCVSTEVVVETTDRFSVCIEHLLSSHRFTCLSPKWKS